MCKVSIIIPAYNCEKYIAETLDSVLAQTFQDFEIIVVDDGSSDGTKKVLERYWDKIRYFYQENQGVSAARNRGIAESQGEYISFLDNDDIWLPEKLELQVPLLESNPDVAMLCTDGEKFMDGKVLHPSFRPTPPKETAIRGQYFGRKIAQSVLNDGMVLKGDFYEDLFLECFIFNSSVLVRKSCLDNVGLIDGNLIPNSDYDLWLRLSSKYPLMYLNRVTARWRVHCSSLSGGLSIRNYNYARWDGVLFEKHLQFCPADFMPLALERIYRSYLTAAFGYFQHNDFLESRRLAFKVLEYKFFQPKVWVYLLATFFPVGVILFLKRLKAGK